MQPAGANLRGAILREADLQGANLRGARNLSQKQLAEAIINEKTSLPDHLERYRDELLGKKEKSGDYQW